MSQEMRISRSRSYDSDVQNMEQQRRRSRSRSRESDVEITYKEDFLKSVKETRCLFKKKSANLKAKFALA